MSRLRRNIIFTGSAALVLIAPGVRGATPADLTITTTINATPSTVVAGNKVQLPAWTVKNIGGTASASFSNGFFLSSSPVINPATATLLDSNGNTSLAAGASFNWGAPTLTIPAATPAGSYYIGIFVNNTESATESDYTNNYVSTPLTVTGNLPDLTITTTLSVSPTSVTPGSKVQLSSWTVANQGASASGSFQNAFYLSSSPVITTAGTLLGTNSNTSLAPGGSFTWSAGMITIPASTPAGIYYLGILVNYNNAVTESNYSNNYASAALTVTGNLPDLTIATQITVTPTSVSPGGTVQLSSWTVANQGGTASGSFQNAFYLSASPVITTAGTLLGTNSNTSLAPGASFTWNAGSLTIPAGTQAGVYYIGILVNYNSAVTESNYNNNYVSTALTVTGGLPDLTVSTSIAVTPTSIAAGGTVQLSSWTVTNQGGSASGSFSNGFYLSASPVITAGATPLGSNSNTSLAPGASFTWGGPTLTIPAGTPAGNYYIGVLVNNTGGVTESNTNNNYVSTPLTVTGNLPDLTVSTSIAVTPTSIAAGGTVQLSSWTVTNQGGSASGSFSNGFYLSVSPVITAGTTLLGSNSNTSLVPGASFTWGGPTLTIPAGTPAGSYYIGILVNNTGSVTESNTNNNYVSTPLTVTGATCSYSFQPTSGTFSAAGGAGSFSVSVATGCSWTPSATTTWIHITPVASGSGNGTVGYSVDPNNSGVRTGGILVGGQTFVVNQSAGGPPAPVISQGGIADPWTYVVGLAPGAWVSIFGTNLSNTTQSWSPQAGQLMATSLGGVTVAINGILAVPAYVSPTLVNVLVPSGVPVGAANVVVSNNGLAGAPYSIQSTEYLPTIYANPQVGTNPARFYATAVDPFTGLLVGNSSVDARVSRFAHAGDTLDLFGVGLGPATPFTTDTAFTGAYPLTSTFAVNVGGFSITPIFAGLVSPGLYQVRVILPSTLPPGDQLIQLNFGSAMSAQSVYLSVQ
jgi:uncharacterized protein (TIGR03437 family)